jgi:type VI secretion system protein ImpH
MADATRQPPDPVTPPGTETPALATLFEKIVANPWANGFYQTLRSIEAETPNHPRLGRSARPRQDVVRLAQEPSAIFAAAPLSAFNAAEEGRPPRITVHFFGLFGPDGPLPLHLTDYARDRRRNHRDPSFQRFADIFHHRALCLFWRAWADVRPTISFDRPAEDRYQSYIGALTGLGQETLRDRDAMPDLTKFHFAGLFANQTRHASGLGAILSAFFTMPVRVECFVGAWLTLPPLDRSALGIERRSGVLGESILLGASVWSRQNKFRIVAGPLSLPDYLRLLPGGQSFKRLIPIVRNYAGDTMLWDVNMVLRAEEVPKTLLGRQGRLGWTTWLHPRHQTSPAADLFLDASADSLARRFDEKDTTLNSAGEFA